MNPILIGCEESQTTTKAFRALGYEAYSCDLKPTRGNPDWHYQDDILSVIETRQWSFILLHPDCTAMALSGNRWYGKGSGGERTREAAIEWTTHLWGAALAHSNRVALENPASVVFQYLPLMEALQYIQPWQFGHGETKKTGLALYNLPPLKPTNIVEGRESRVHRMAPGPNRKRDRSKTYSGVAEAIATQWGPLLFS